MSSKGNGDGFGSVCCADFLEYGIDMEIHVILPDTQLLGNVAVG